jgi:hypothetical protein
MLLKGKVHLNSSWSPWGLHGLFMDSSWTPCKVIMESMRSLWGVHVDFIRTLDRLYMDYVESMWSPWGVHGNLWGTVKYSIAGPDRSLSCNGTVECFWIIVVSSSQMYSFRVGQDTWLVSAGDLVELLFFLLVMVVATAKVNIHVMRFIVFMTLPQPTSSLSLSYKHGWWH